MLISWRRIQLQILNPANAASWPHQVKFSLTSSPIFSRTDLATDSERFYNSIVEFLEDPEENTEVQELLVWWNR